MSLGFPNVLLQHMINSRYVPERVSRYAALLLLAFAIPAANAKALWGYVDQKGNVVIKPQFVRAGKFMHGFAECYGYSKETGKPDWRQDIFVDKTRKRYVLETNGSSRPISATKIYDEIEVPGKHIVQDNYISVWSKRGQFMFVKREYDFCVSDLAETYWQK